MTINTCRLKSNVFMIFPYIHIGIYGIWVEIVICTCTTQQPLFTYYQTFHVCQVDQICWPEEDSPSTVLARTHTVKKIGRFALQKLGAYLLPLCIVPLPQIYFASLHLIKICKTYQPYKSTQSSPDGSSLAEKGRFQWVQVDC